MSSSKELKIIINGKDNTGATFKGLTNKLEDAKRASNAFALSLAGITASVGLFGLKTAGQLETAEIGLTTLLGSAEEASATIKRIKEEAKRTPFELTGLTTAVQLLSSVTKDGDKATDIILDVGEGLAAMGKGQTELDRIIVNLQQVAALGKAQTVDIKQFAYAGIPIFEMLQEETGLAGEALGDFIEDGNVSFDVLVKMFDKANDEGGRFFNAYINQTGSLNQSWSNLIDTLTIASSEFVKQTGIFDLAKKAIVSLSDNIGILSDKTVAVVNFLKENQTVFYMVAGAIAGALAPAVWGLVAAFAAGALALAPFILGGALIAGLIAGIYSVVTNWDESKESLKFIWETIKEIFTSGVDWVKGQLDKMVGWIQEAIESIKELLRAFDQLSLKNVGDAWKNVGSNLKWAFGGGKAIGGPVSAGTSYLVGEKGPELFTPGASGFITPNHQLAGAGGINITISGNTLLDSRAAERIGDMIIKKLGYSTKL
ncbi:MAG: hypothetical protein C4519_24400 [Desulfobacteraceae bacterium]|nr:MAG: hypothetical protein C4519_24400 [Desulfobacteraceae bacterium]